MQGSQEEAGEAEPDAPAADDDILDADFEDLDDEKDTYAERMRSDNSVVWYLLDMSAKLQVAFSLACNAAPPKLLDVSVVVMLLL